MNATPNTRPFHPRPPVIAGAFGGHLNKPGAEIAISPRPCPQCQWGKPCGGWLRPVAGKRGMWKCGKCGRTVFIRPEKEEKHGRKGDERG